MKIDLAEIGRVCEAATEGPWVTRFIYRLFKSGRQDKGLLMQTHPCSDWPDANFIALSRTALPACKEWIEKANDLVGRLIDQAKMDEEKAAALAEFIAAILAADEGCGCCEEEE